MPKAWFKTLEQVGLQNAEERKKSLMEEILDYLKEERSLVENERIRRAKAKADLETVAFMQ
jgi:hypothetical protein